MQHHDEDCGCGPGPEPKARLSVIHMKSPDISIVKLERVFDNRSHNIERKRMSAKTQFHSIYAVATLFAALGLAMSLAPSSVCAGPADDARGDYNQSMNDFYNALKASPDKSPAAAKKLSAEIIEPAEQKLMKAQMENGGGNSSSSNSGARGSSQGGRTGGSDAMGGGDAAPSEPETALDGKDVPALLEFPGPVHSPKKSK
jgi:hypothetical protein